jgi:tetratricopeptide (TPR) repeat protein
MKNVNKPKGDLSPEIVKLSERLAKDPTSNLFVYLAEEYVKSGMPDEALMVLNDGLKIHPGFVRARVVLGKIYLDKGKLKEAKEQFETVIRENPDNLLVHRKLVKIYRGEKDFQKAIESCRVVLNSNPKDEEMKKDLMDLEADRANAGTVAESRHEPINISSSVPENPVSAPGLNTATSEQDAAAPPKTLEDEAGHTIELKEDDASLEEIMDLMGQEGKVEKAEPDAKTSEEVLASESLAELYIQQGFYDKGIEIYKVLLLKNPGNEILQKKLNDATARSKDIPKTSIDLKAETPVVVNTLLSEGETPAVKEVYAETDSEQISSAPLPGRQSKEEKIQKLQVWLDQIKRGRTQ